MNYLDLTFRSPAANLALDQALLDAAEVNGDGEALRFWEPDRWFVVLGRGGRAAEDARADACRRDGVPVLRRCSGGGAVVQGPGCLNYSLILKIDGQKALAGIRDTHGFVMDRHRRSLGRLLGPGVRVQGDCDLALGSLKFSGNAQRRGRRFVLYHGTVLLSMDIGRMAAWLPVPARQPSYRGNRGHDAFLTNTGLPAGDVRRALRRAWGVETVLSRPPLAAARRLVREFYAREEWNLRL